MSATWRSKLPATASTSTGLHGVRIAAAGFTNLTRDHLDYHKTFEAYLDAKMMLFEQVLGEGAAAIINADMPQAGVIIERCEQARPGGVDRWLCR